MTTTVDWRGTPSADVPITQDSTDLKYDSTGIEMELEGRNRHYRSHWPDRHGQVQVAIRANGVQLAYLIYTLVCLGEEGVNWFSNFPFDSQRRMTVRQVGKVHVERNADSAYEVNFSAEVLNPWQ